MKFGAKPGGWCQKSLYPPYFSIRVNLNSGRVSNVLSVILY